MIFFVSIQEGEIAKITKAKMNSSKPLLGFVQTFHHRNAYL